MKLPAWFAICAYQKPRTSPVKPCTLTVAFIWACNLTRARTSLLTALVLCIWFIQVAVAAGLNLPTLSGRVVDQANIFSPGEERQLTAIFADQEARTHNQAVVITVPSLQGKCRVTHKMILASKYTHIKRFSNHTIVASIRLFLQITCFYPLRIDRAYVRNSLIGLITTPATT